MTITLSHGAYVPRSETTALAARMVAAGGATMPRFLQQGFDAFFARAAASTWWARVTDLRLLRLQDTASSVLNIKGATTTMTNVGGKLAAWQGFQTGTKGYLDTGYNLATGGGALAQDDAHVGWVVLDPPVAGAYEVGAGSNVRLTITANSSGNRLHNATAAASMTNKTFSSIGHKVVVRSAGGVLSYYHDGLLLGTATQASVAMEAATLKIGGAPDAGGANPEVRYVAEHFGGALSAAEVLDLNHALMDLLATIDPTFPLWQSLPDNLQFSMDGLPCWSHNAGLSYSMAKRGDTFRAVVHNQEFSTGAGDVAGDSKSRSEILRYPTATGGARQMSASVNASTKVITFAGSIFSGALLCATFNSGSWTGAAGTVNNSTYMTARAGLKTYWYQATASDTLATAVAALAAKIAIDFPGTTSAAGVITPSGASAYTVNAFTGGETYWLWTRFEMAPSPIGVANACPWGPLVCQIKTGDAHVPALSLTMSGEDWYISADTLFAYPFSYAGNQRWLGGKMPVGRGAKHEFLVKFVDGIGIDLTNQPGWGTPGVMGPNYDATDRTRTGSGFGAIEAWIDGVPVLNVTGIPTSCLDSSTGLYAKGGIYAGDPFAAGDWFQNDFQLVFSSSDLSSYLTNPPPLY